jgi:hypothetical protein
VKRARWLIGMAMQLALIFTVLGLVYWNDGFRGVVAVLSLTIFALLVMVYLYLAFKLKNGGSK